MGFDLFIHLKLSLCPGKGMPYYFNTNFEKVYGLPELSIPEHLRSYLQGRGSFFHIYTERFEEQCVGYEVDVDQFLEAYPEWEEVVNHPQYDEYWTKEDHEKFRELLDLLSHSRYPFSVSWC